MAVHALETKDAKEFCRRLASERLIEEFVVGGRQALHTIFGLCPAVTN